MDDTELLSDKDLAIYAKNLKIPLHGILQKDKFYAIQKLKRGGYVVNLQSSDIGNGTHWTGLVITKSHAIYFDSFGLPIPTPVLKAIYRTNKQLKVIYSTDRIQTMDSIRCGWYVLYFLYFFLTLYPQCSQSKLLLNKHNAIYSLQNKHLNDKILQKLIKSLFRKN